MSITGSLSDFSLPEILQFIELGRKTGLLTVRALSESEESKSSVHYIWVKQGHIVGAANRLDQQGLVMLIEQRQWVSNRVITKVAQLCPTDKPLGKYLFNQGVLRAEQLKELFLIQILQYVCALFDLEDGIFQFDQNVPLPRRELTGLSLAAGIPGFFATSLDALALGSNESNPSFAAKNLTQHSSYSHKTSKFRMLSILKSLLQKVPHSLVA